MPEGEEGAHNMQARSGFEPWWAALTVWAVVNAVNVLQAAGFLSRVPTESLTHALLAHSEHGR
jgi:hypothetical protein